MCRQSRVRVYRKSFDKSTRFWVELNQFHLEFICITSTLFSYFQITEKKGGQWPKKHLVYPSPIHNLRDFYKFELEFQEVILGGSSWVKNYEDKIFLSQGYYMKNFKLLNRAYG